MAHVREAIQAALDRRTQVINTIRKNARDFRLHLTVIDSPGQALRDSNSKEAMTTVAKAVSHKLRQIEKERLRQQEIEVAKKQEEQRLKRLEEYNNRPRKRVRKRGKKKHSRRR